MRHANRRDAATLIISYAVNLVKHTGLDNPIVGIVARSWIYEGKSKSEGTFETALFLLASARRKCWRCRTIPLVRVSTGLRTPPSRILKIACAANFSPLPCDHHLMIIFQTTYVRVDRASIQTTPRYIAGPLRKRS